MTGRSILLMGRSTFVLLVEAIRRYLASPEAADAGVAIAIRDRRIATALASILRKPEADWDVETLARRAGISRTAFATRFSELIGESPLRYVAQCRMKRAAALLKAGSATIPQIAERVGYESDVGFSRAFKRHMGSSPAMYRRARGS